MRHGSVAAPVRSMKAERNATSGDTRRTASKGKSVNKKQITNPAPTPRPTAGHAMKKSTSIGRTPCSTTGNNTCNVIPSAAPRTAPNMPSAMPCTTYTEKLCAALAPRQRSTATVAIFWRT